MPMNSELRAGYRAEVERKGRALKAMREARGVRSDKGPCAFDKVQLKDWYTSLQIANEEWRCAYVTAMVDYWFTGVTPDYLDDIPKAYFNANFERLSDARRQSFAKSDTGEDSSLEAWVDGRNGTIPADGEGVPNPVPDPVPSPVPNPVPDGVQPLHSYKLPTTSHEPQAISHGPTRPLANGKRTTGYGTNGSESLFETGVAWFHVPCPKCGEVAKEPVGFIDGMGQILVKCPNCGVQTYGKPPEESEVERCFPEPSILKCKEENKQ